MNQIMKYLILKLHLCQQKIEIDQEIQILYINICFFLILDINMIGMKHNKNLKCIRMFKKNNKLFVKWNKELRDNVNDSINFITELTKNLKIRKEKGI